MLSQLIWQRFQDSLFFSIHKLKKDNIVFCVSPANCKHWKLFGVYYLLLLLLQKEMASVKIPEQKVILCGEYGVGKSSIFRRFINDTFIFSSDRRSTLGLDHFSKVYNVADDKYFKVI